MLLTGTEGPDLLVGGSGNDTITGAGNPGAADTLEGRGGDDSLDGGTGDDYLAGGTGNDTARGGAGNDVFREADIESAGDDLLDGGDGNDEFNDFLGNNTLLGGAGEDLFVVSQADDGSHIATGGEGADIWRILSPRRPAADNTYTVTDFRPVADADRIDVRFLLQQSIAEGHLRNGNPFDASNAVLRFIQDGADSLLQWDRDGAQGAQFDWVTMLRLQGTQVASLDAESILGGVPLTGDTIAGREIRASDTGGEINGWLGDDSLTGGDGDDRFNAAEDGALIYPLSLGDDTLDGGAGDDTLVDWMGNNLFLGGDGDDRITVYSIDGSTTVVTGGPGRDTYTPLGVLAFDYQVTDFVAGPGGDRIDLGELLAGSALNGHYAQGNPFDPSIGIFRLEQVGADTLVQADFDGASEVNSSWRTVLTLRDVRAETLTVDNFAGPLYPDGSAGPVGRLVGTAGDDDLRSDFDADEIEGLDGNDLLWGFGGDDRIAGGNGSDTLIGGLGRDVLDGGAGDDLFVELFQSDVHAGDDELRGGAGNDTLSDDFGRNLLAGEDGDDTFIIRTGRGDTDNTLTGGSGRDTYDIGLPAGRNVSTDFRPGAGGDQLDLDRVLAESSWLAGSAGYSNGNPFTQGFLRLIQSGADTLLQCDPDGSAGTWNWRTVLVLKNVDKTRITSDNFVGQLLVGTEAADTLSGGLGNDTIRGLGGNDALNGAEGRDTLDGGSGADTMAGGPGGDTYLVDSRNDAVIEAAQGKSALPFRFAAAREADPLATGSNVDTVIAQVSYTLRANVEKLQLAGSADLSGAGNSLDNLIVGNVGGNRLSGLGGNDLIDGGSGADTLEGGSGRDTLTGGAGPDLLRGGEGNDSLVGAAGADVFAFDSPLVQGAVPDIVVDFVPGTDRVLLDDDVFAAFSAATSTRLSVDAFRVASGGLAVDADDRIIYDAGTGGLFYDEDGTGPATSIRFATLGGAPALSANDFVVGD